MIVGPGQRASCLIEAPPEYLPEGISSARADLATLRAAAEAHNRHPIGYDVSVPAWVVLWLLDQVAAALRTES